jgi:hypothetical protein
MMTIEQAIAILEAEQALQGEWRGGPDAHPNTPWHNLVKEALAVVEKAPGYWGWVWDLEMVKEIQETTVNNGHGI